MWEAAKNWFSEQSALANFLQIAGTIFAVAVACWRGAKWIQQHRRDKRRSTVSLWLEGRVYGPKNAHSLKVAVVDDRPEDYPLDTLRQLGYSIVHIGHLTLANVPSLLKYDCVLLDINGVLEEDLAKGGLQILKRLKAADGPYVVAVSSRGFDITLSDFFMLADHRLKKPIPPADVEGIIERAFVDKFSAANAARRIDQALGLGGTHTRATRSALYAMRRYLETGKGVEDTQKALNLFIPGDRLQATLMDLNIIRKSLSRAP